MSLGIYRKNRIQPRLGAIFSCLIDFGIKNYKANKWVRKQGACLRRTVFKPTGFMSLFLFT